MEALQQDSAGRTPATAAVRARPPRAQHRSSTGRLRGPAREREHGGLDHLYLSEMAARTVLTAQREVELGREIAAGEHRVLDGLVRSPTGAGALAALAVALSAGAIDVRDILLNPDEAGLDLSVVQSSII